MAETRTAARMARLIAQWRKSDESAASFARRHHIPAWTFWYWRRKLATEAATPTAPRFVPVQIATEADAAVLEIALAGGERVHVRAGASPELVRAAVTALRSSC